MLWGGDPVYMSQPIRVERAMASYWLKHNSNSLAEGPYNASQLKAMAAAGQISSAALISNDREKWTPATQVKGLFSAQTMAPVQPRPQPPPPPPSPAMAPMPAPPQAPATYDDSELPPSAPYDLQYPDPPALPPPAVPQAVPIELGYAGAPRGNASHTGITGEVRDLKGYLVATIVVAAIAFAGQIASGQYHLVPATSTSGFRSDPSPLGAAGNCFALMAWIALLIYGFVWVGKSHSEIFDFTGGQYPTKPAMAVGFCFIPFFNLYWIPAMMFGLANEIERYLGPGRISPTKVLVFQILAFVPGCCVGAISPIFFALAVLEIQKGLNELWTMYKLPVRRFRY